MSASLAIEPEITPAAPTLANPTVVTSAKALKTSVSFSNRTSTVGVPYRAKDRATIGSIYIGDHNLDGCAAVARLDNGEIGEVVIERISLLRGKYGLGVACGLLHIAGAHIGSLTIRDCDYDRAQYITSPGDVYAGVMSGGGHNPDGSVYGSCNSFLIERVRARNAWTAYPEGSTAYPNSDFIVFESSFVNGLIRNCDLRYAADAGIDRKGTNCRVESTIIEDCRNNFKTWTSSHDGDVYSRLPRSSHWLVASKPDRVTEQVVDFAEIVGIDPSIEIVNFQHGPGILRILNSVMVVPEGQVLATADSASLGSKVIIGDREITVDKPLVML